MTDDGPKGPIDATNKRFMALLNQDGGPLTAMWLMMSVLTFVYAFLWAGITYRTHAPMMHEFVLDFEGTMQAYGPQNPSRFNMASVLLYPLQILVLALSSASMKIIVAVDRDGADSLDFAQARALLLERFGPTCLAAALVWIASLIGGMCCVVPGLVAGFFMMYVPYLNSTNSRNVFAAVSTSKEWAMRHWKLTLLMTVIGYVLIFAMVAAIIVGSIAFEPMLGRKAILAGGMSGWFIALIGGYIVWMYTGAIYATIERFESQLGGIADIFE